MSSTESETQRVFLGKHTYPISKQFVPIAVNSAAQVALLLGLDEALSLKLQMAVEEAVLNVVDHSALTGGLDDFVDLVFNLEADSLVSSIFEKGIPFQPQGSDRFSFENENIEKPGLGLYMLESLMDDVEQIVHGNQGKETKLTLLLPEGFDREGFVSSLTEAGNNPALRSSLKNYVIRRANLDDIPGIIRLAWKCYGYSRETHLYELDFLKRELESERLVSFVAENLDGNVLVAHLALIYHLPNLPEIGLAFLDMSYRCPTIMRELTDKLKEFMHDHSDVGAFDRALTTHTFSQKALQENGSLPCCLSLGGAVKNFKVKMAGDVAQDKGSTISHFQVYKRSETTVFIPERHRGMVMDIYNWLQLPRNIGTPRPIDGNAHSEVVLKPMSDEYDVADIDVYEIGASTMSQILEYTQYSFKQKVDVCFLNLPLQSACLPALVEAAEAEGFSFAGIIPYLHRGEDRLVLHKLNTDIDLEKVRVYGDRSRQLLDYVAAELKN